MYGITGQSMLLLNIYLYSIFDLKKIITGQSYKVKANIWFHNVETFE